ncbi:hypothetical protein H8F24_09315 [Synechococcus sp. CBW1002]|uniref:hypothetical protein n=1 Tax=unclassified Synechococcus TaxID=2626047 RepID=UPI0018CDA3EA|nr:MULTISPECIES: hypothetical protein [unclassified Synechococcus]QPN58446.1 hypothetical protein H8F24_09315 [Synechococcus sp. CBW1002]QPN68058.1 hypothetical protein H8F26_08235 [Synechococcus sp. CBW1006]
MATTPNNLKSNPRASHASLVEWYVSECTDQTGANKYAQALLLARELDQLYETNETTCGFEYHHYKPDSHPDYLVYCNAKQFANGGRRRIVPEWWPKVQRDCIEGCDLSFAGPGLYLPCENWIEFDQGSDDLIMAGIWQMVRSNGEVQPGDWEKIVSTLESWQSGEGSIACSKTVRHFYQLLGHAAQIGLMCGRGSYLKLMKQHLCPTQIDSHIQYLASITNDSWDLDLESYSTILKEHGNYLRPATSVDIDLDSDILLSQIGIEIHPQGLLGRALPKTVHRLVGDVFKVDSAQIESISSLLSYLPKGIEMRGFLDGAERIATKTRVAKLNHIKIIFSPDSKARLKSYVRLVEQHT